MGKIYTYLLKYENTEDMLRWECKKYNFLKFKWYLFKVNHIMRQVVLGGMHNNSNSYDKKFVCKRKETNIYAVDTT